MLHLLADIVGQGDVTLDTCLLLLEISTLLHLLADVVGRVTLHACLLLLELSAFYTCMLTL